MQVVRGKCVEMEMYKRAGSQANVAPTGRLGVLSGVSETCAVVCNSPALKLSPCLHVPDRTAAHTLGSLCHVTLHILHARRTEEYESWSLLWK